MGSYWAKFVPSVAQGMPPGDWERFFNAENPARALKQRAREQYGRFHAPNLGWRGPWPVIPFYGADQSAMLLVWLTREQPEADEAPDEVWHLTNRYGLIRTPWSAIIEPLDNSDVNVDDLVDAEDLEVPHEPSITDHLDAEAPVTDVVSTEPEAIWRPPTLDEIAERRVILVGDKRPTSSGAFVERNVERFAPKGVRQPCETCHVMPNPITNDCKCWS